MNTRLITTTSAESFVGANLVFARIAVLSVSHIMTQPLGGGPNQFGMNGSTNFLYTCNRWLDRFATPSIRIFHKTFSAFYFCAFTGFALAIPSTVISAIHLGLSPWIMILIIIISWCTFLLGLIVGKIITGKEDLVFYRNMILIIAANAFALTLMDYPVLPYLDVFILGIGLFHVCGRIGCLMMGCCHGRPHKWGVCYHQKHARTGFPSYYIGIRLFPTQVLEALWVLGIVIAGSLLILEHQPAGEVFVSYVIAYAVGRFMLEFMRGDPTRLYFAGFSEGQWISFLLLVGVVWGEGVGMLPYQVWHIAVSAGMAAVIMTIAFKRRFDKTARHRLLNPRHVKKLATVLDRLTDTSDREPHETAIKKGHITIGATSLGIRISTGSIMEAGTTTFHYTFSSQKETMNQQTAEVLSELIIQLKHPGQSHQLVTRNPGIFHLFIQSHPFNQTEKDEMKEIKEMKTGNVKSEC